MAQQVLDDVDGLCSLENILVSALVTSAFLKKSVNGDIVVNSVVGWIIYQWMPHAS